MSSEQQPDLTKSHITSYDVLTMVKRWSECGALIKELRSKQKITQADLAKKIGKSASLICRIERGERRPNQRVLLSLSVIFGVPIQVLQQKAGYTPEFDWYVSLLRQQDQEKDILLTASESEKNELRHYLLYLRFKATVSKAGQSLTDEAKS